MAFGDYLTLFLASTAGCESREHSFVIGLSTAVEDSYYETVREIAQGTESALQVEQWDLSFGIGEDNLAVVVLHHAVAAVVHDGQGLAFEGSVVVDLALVLPKDLFEGFVFDVGLLDDVGDTEAVFLYFLAEQLDILYDCGEVVETFLNWVTGFVLSHEADGLVVEVSEDEALAEVGGEIGHFGLAEDWHFKVVGGWV